MIRGGDRWERQREADRLAAYGIRRQLHTDLGARRGLFDEVDTTTPTYWWAEPSNMETISARLHHWIEYTKKDFPEEDEGIWRLFAVVAWLVGHYGDRVHRLKRDVEVARAQCAELEDENRKLKRDGL